MKRFYTPGRYGIATAFGLLTTGCLPALAQQTTPQERFGPDQLQTLGVGSRAVAMGNAFAAIADDASASFWNPGRLGFLANTRQAMLSYRTVGNSFARNNISGVNDIGFQPGKPQLGFASFTYPLNKRGGGSLGIVAVSYTLGGYFSEDRSQISLANDINGNPAFILNADGKLSPVTYTSSDVRTVVRNSFLTFAYGRQINDHLGIGIGVFFLNQDFNKQSDLFTYAYDPAHPTADPLKNPNTASERGRGYGANFGLFYRLQKPNPQAVEAVQPEGNPTAETPGAADTRLRPPATPTGLTATPHKQRIEAKKVQLTVRVKWKASKEAFSYTLSRRVAGNEQPDKVISGLKGTSYTDADVKNDTTYFYTVRAVNQYYGDKGLPVAGTSAESPSVSVTPYDTGIEYLFGLSYRSQTHLSGLRDQGEGFNEEIPGRFSFGIAREQDLRTYYARHTKSFGESGIAIEKDHLVTSLELQVLQAANRSTDAAGNLRLVDARRAVGNVHFGLEYTPGKFQKSGEGYGYKIPIRFGVHTNSNAAYKYSYYDTVFSFGMAYIEKSGSKEKYSIEPTLEVLTRSGTFNFTLTGQLKF